MGMKFVFLIGCLLFELNSSTTCTAPDPQKFPLRWKDKIAAHNCMPDETKTQDPYRFEYYCREPNCFSKYEDQPIEYQWDATCRKCVPCTANECRPPNLDSGPKKPCDESKGPCTTEKPVNCGQHGTNANSYSCNCEPGWKNDVTAGTFCSVKEISGVATLKTAVDAGAQQTGIAATVIVIIVVVAVILLALCSCCLAYFCKKRKENREILQFIRAAAAGADLGASQQVQSIMKEQNQNVKKTPAGAVAHELDFNKWRDDVKEFCVKARSRVKFKKGRNPNIDIQGEFLSYVLFE